MMSPVSFVFSFLFAIVNAASIPTCIKDYSSIVLPFGVSHILNYTTQFCAHITSSNYSSNFRSYGVESTLLSIVTLDFTSGTAGCSGNTTAANCEDVYRDLLSGCGDNNCTLTGSGTIDTGCGIYTFQLTNANSNNVNTSSVSNASSVSSKSGSGKASGVSYCMVTGSVLLGVAAFFGWFL